MGLGIRFTHSQDDKNMIPYLAITMTLITMRAAVAVKNLFAKKTYIGSGK